MTDFQIGVLGPGTSLLKDPVSILADPLEPRIGLIARAVRGGGTPLYVFRKEVGLSGEVLTRVRVETGAASTRPATAGLLVRWSEHEQAGRYTAGVSSSGKLFVELALPDEAPQRWEAPLPASQQEVALRLRADGDSLQYYASTVDGAKRDVWVPVGAPFYATPGTTVGMYLDPGDSLALFPQNSSATFTSFSVRELRAASAKPRGLAKVGAGAPLAGVPFDLFRNPLPAPNYPWGGIGSGPTAPIPLPPGEPLVPFQTVRPGPLDVPLPVLDTCRSALPFVPQSCPRGQAAPELPEGDPSQLVTRLRNAYPFQDPVATKLYETVGELKTRPLLPFPAGASAAERLRVSSYNAETYLADVVHGAVQGTEPSIDHRTVPLSSHFPYMTLVRQLRRTIEFCNDAADISWGELLTGYAIVDAADCKKEIEDAMDDLDALKKDLPDADKALLNVAEYLQTLGLLSLVDPDFLAYTVTFTIPARVVNGIPLPEQTLSFQPHLGLVKALSGEVNEWVDFVHPLLDDGNIPTKAQAGLATLDLVFRRKRGLAGLARYIDRNFTPGGAYGEGTGYLRYVNDQLLPLYAVAKISGRLPADLLPARFVASGQWLRELSDPSGLIPAIDDANAARDGFLAPYAVLTGDHRYKDFVQGDRFRVRPLVCVLPGGQIAKECSPNEIPHVTNGANLSVAQLLSYPIDMTGPAMTFADRVVTEGAGKLNTLSGDIATSLTLLAENGQLLGSGGAHDQQDGLSVALNRSRPTSSGIAVDRLIVDPGYPGFKLRGQTARFLKHNVPYLLDGGGVSPNGPVTGDEAVELLLSVFPEAYEGRGSSWWHLNFGDALFSLAVFLGPLAYDLSGTTVERYAGGGSSSILGSSANGLTARLDYDTDGSEYALRSTFREGDEYVIVDSLHSRRGSFGVRFALPATATGSGGSAEARVDEEGSAVGASRLVMDVRSQHPGSERSELRSSGLPGALKELVVENRSASSGHSFFSYLTVAQALDENAQARSYEPCSQANTAICLRAAVPEGTRMVFVNLRDDSRTWTMRLPSPAGQERDLFTDAAFGTVTFDADGRLASTHLFGVTKAW
ncbi:MAG TPA: hypothetical protein VM686_17195, partial [Polyangiaceae bacterium]|nr:hypothetical protein [Polyangiaceae bacterium]